MGKLLSVNSLVFSSHKCIMCILCEVPGRLYTVQKYGEENHAGMNLTIQTFVAQASESEEVIRNIYSAGCIWDLFVMKEEFVFKQLPSHKLRKPSEASGYKSSSLSTLVIQLASDQPRKSSKLTTVHQQ